MEPRKISDLSDEELLEGYNSVEDQINAEYKILSSLKGTKNEYLYEILKRFGGNKNGTFV